MLNDNIILLSDSYKASHAKQYPEKCTSVFSYLESRGSDEGFRECVSPNQPRQAPFLVFDVILLESMR